MPRKGKKKVQAADEDPEVEVIMRVEVIYEDTKAVTGSEPEYKWGEIYQMITNRSIPDTGLEDFPIYANIERSVIIIGFHTTITFSMCRINRMNPPKGRCNQNDFVKYKRTRLCRL